MSEHENKSAIARFREQQALEEESLRLAISGFAITARHDFIVARMQRGGERILQIIAEGKHDEAQVLLNCENWGVAEDAEAELKGGERESNGQAQSAPSANISAQLQ